MSASIVLKNSNRRVSNLPSPRNWIYNLTIRKECPKCVSDPGRVKYYKSLLSLYGHLKYAHTPSIGISESLEDFHQRRESEFDPYKFIISMADDLIREISK